MTNEFELLVMGQQFKKICEKKYEDLMKRYGLRKIELDILYFLEHAGEHNTAKDIARIRQVSKAHISSAVEHLAGQGLIRSEPDPQDRRCVHLTATRQGAAVAKEILTVRRQVSEIVYQGITPEERQMMQQISAKIFRNLQKEIAKN